MGKKETYEPLARQYYVEAQVPISGIAKRLNITEKTLHSWKKEGDWDGQRAKFLHAQFSCYGSLYELVKLLSEDAKNRFLTDGELPDAKTVNFLRDMVKQLPTLKNFENGLALEKIEEVKEQEPQAKTDKTSTITEIDKFLKGLG